ncbi:MAG: hypothetical protein IJL78_00540 [Lachnospiraceae bacterium]|nr:hypothetical protein [Lachnospiraceae bacterium]
MLQKRSLKRYEVRVLRFDKSTIFKIIKESLKEISYIRFQLPRNTENAHIDWIFDIERYELLLYAYSTREDLNKDAVIEYIKNYPMDSLESLLTIKKGKYYYSIKDPSLFIAHTELGAKTKCVNRKGKGLRSISAAWRGHICPIRKHELRMIRLSIQGVKELVFEYFMDFGNTLFDIPVEDKDFGNNIYCMSLNDDLEDLIVYAVNLNEVSSICFEKVDAYCEEHICFASDFNPKVIETKPYYTSMILPESFIIC